MPSSRPEHLTVIVACSSGVSTSPNVLQCTLHRTPFGRLLHAPYTTLAALVLAIGFKHTIALLAAVVVVGMSAVASTSGVRAAAVDTPLETADGGADVEAGAGGFEGPLSAAAAAVDLMVSSLPPIRQFGEAT
jgi:hypothetical protein